MQAAYYERVGAAQEVLQVGEMPTPEPGAGEVRVRVRWSGVNPSDVKTRGGLRTKTLPFPRIVPHSDGMGVIDAVGDGVPASRVGERVWLWNAAWGRPFGTAAQCVVLPQAQAVRLPDATPDEAGACLGIPALTALHAVITRGGVQGQRVLVAGGAGAVGHYAVQFARQLGAQQVITTVSSAEKAAVASAAGAHAVIDYKREDVAARVKELTGGHGIDRVIELDIGVNRLLDLEVLRAGGLAVVYGSSQQEFSLPFAPLLLKGLALQFFIVYSLTPEERLRATDLLTEFLERGQLQHQIGERLPLSQIARAHELVEGGRAMGNVVLSMG